MEISLVDTWRNVTYTTPKDADAGKMLRALTAGHTGENPQLEIRCDKEFADAIAAVPDLGVIPAKDSGRSTMTAKGSVGHSTFQGIPIVV
ncbi:MAG TPA: hypothetical protein VNZ47_11775, partial [Candidatus Dormibacteraeota bacterium]|nr:hypothetical protein [Candidatus Dormibacteraeota bacterium]